MKLAGFQIIELSGEHPNLPISDAMGCLRGLGARPAEAECRPRFLAFRPSVDPEALASRLALSRYVGNILLSGDLGEVHGKAADVELRDRSFRLRVADYEGGADKPSIEASIGRRLASVGRVDLERPEVDLRLILSGSAYLYQVAASVDRRSFDTRKAGRRPFSLPVSLHPKLARALVNLTGVAEGEVLLDPFCGTGGVLMEAALIKARAAGSDLKEEMVGGCQDNLTFFGLKAELRVCDVGDVAEEFGQVDAIATDPPYGRSAGTVGEELPRLLKRGFLAFRGMLRHEGRLAICLPAPEYLDLGRKYMSLLEWHALPVHRSLVRYFSVFQRT